jgi:hypothetical protein
VTHETCLNCRLPEAGDPDVLKLILVSESLGGLAHHHHTVKCGGCGQWWFDDLVIGGLGVPVASRRDTVLCDCDDGLPQYTISAVLVPGPEDECACTKAKCEEFSLPIRLGSRPER